MFLLQAIFFISYVSSSLIMKLVDSAYQVNEVTWYPSSTHHQVEKKMVISDLEALNQIIESSKGRARRKFALLNVIVDDDVLMNHLEPDLYVNEDLVLEDLKYILQQEITDNHDQNIYSIKVKTPKMANELVKKVNLMMNDKSIACYVFITREESWENIMITSKHDKSGKQHIRLSSKKSNDTLSALSSPADFCPVTSSDCEAATGRCSNHGQCTLQNHPLKRGVKCYFCSCTVKRWTNENGSTTNLYSGRVDWTGPACQYQDISISFHIVFWTILGLIVVVIFSIGLLYDIGEGGAGFGVAGSGIANRLKQE